MPKHLRTVLKNISKDDVANCRRSKKQIEKSEDIKIRDLLSGDYWKFVYTARYIFKNYQSLIYDNIKNLKILYPYIDDEYYQIRCIINALACYNAGKETTYQLEKLHIEEASAAGKLLEFSYKFGYYFWDIYNVYDSNSLLDCFITQGSMPNPALPYCNSHEQLARIITFRMAMGSKPEVRESFIDEIKNEKYTLSISSQYGDSSFEKKAKQLELQQKLRSSIIEQLNDGAPRQVEEVLELIKMRKVVVPDNFHYDSIPARCIGLIMYDSIVSPDETCDDIIGKFKTSDIFKKVESIRLFKKSDNAYISDKDNYTLKRWLKITQECIEKMAVLPLK